MDGGEHLRVLDPQPRKGVHVEEAAVVDFVRGRAPVGQAVRLLLEHRVQRVERVRLAGYAVELEENSFAFVRLLEFFRDDSTLQTKKLAFWRILSSWTACRGPRPLAFSGGPGC